MARQKWTDHVFPLGIDTGWSDNIRTRLADVTIRLRHHCNNLSDEQLSNQPAGKWSIKEHVGHLIDLESLHTKRLHEFDKMQAKLSAADMSNAKTEASDHRLRSIGDLISEFSEVRKGFLRLLEQLSEDSLKHQAMHPRLLKKMRPVDLLFFTAEHDDHHIATICEIKSNLLHE